MLKENDDINQLYHRNISLFGLCSLTVQLTSVRFLWNCHQLGQLVRREWGGEREGFFCFPILLLALVDHFLFFIYFTHFWMQFYILFFNSGLPFLSLNKSVVWLPKTKTWGLSSDNTTQDPWSVLFSKFIEFSSSSGSLEILHISSSSPSLISARDSVLDFSLYFSMHWALLPSFLPPLFFFSHSHSAVSLCLSCQSLTWPH